jgi:hypothetical protein
MELMVGKWPERGRFATRFLQFLPNLKKMKIKSKIRNKHTEIVGVNLCYRSVGWVKEKYNILNRF